MNSKDVDASHDDLTALEMDGVAVTATVKPDGRLDHIDGLWEKLGEQTIDLANRGLLHTVVVAKEQDNVPEEYLHEDAEPLRVIKAGTVEEAIRKLNEQSLPRRAILQKVRKECEQLEILGRKKAPMETLYQELPLLLEVEPEKLPRDRERDEHAETDEDERGRWRITELRRWEEEMQQKQVKYERYELKELFTDFRRVVKKAASNAPRLVVLGPPGSGKTTLEQYLAWQTALGELHDGRKYIPVQVKLHNWQRAVRDSESQSSLPKYLAQQHQPIKPASKTSEEWEEQWRRWLRRGDVLLLMDGLDEIQENDSFFETALKNTLSVFPNCPTVLTCRTVSFEQHKALCPDQKEIPVFTLAGLEDKQRNDYINAFPAKHLDQSDKDTLIAQLNGMPQMRPLASNPLLLSIICFVVDEPNGVQLPATRTELYYKAVEKLLLHQKRVDVHYPTSGGDLPLTRKRRIIERASLTLFRALEGQRELTFDEGALLDALTRGAEAEGYRADPAPLADALLADLTKNSGILRGDADRGYFFLHLTIHEYLTACALAQEANGDGFQAIADLVDKKAWLPTWQEVIIFLTGKLPDEKREHLLTILTDETKYDLFRHRLALAALCLSECSRLESESSSPILAIADKVRTELSHLTDDRINPFWEYFMTYSPPQLDRLLQHEESYEDRVAREVTEAISRLGSSATTEETLEATLSYLIRMLEDSPVNVRESGRPKAVCKAFSELDSSAVTEEMLSNISRFLHHEKGDVRYAAVKVIGKLGSSAATEEMLSNLARLPSDEDEDVRWAAAEAVGKLGSSAATEEMLSNFARLLVDKIRHVRRAAVEAVGELGAAAATDGFLSHLARLLSDKSLLVRLTAVEAVGELGAAAATDGFLSQLSRLLEEENSLVRRAAAEAVGELGSSAATDGFLSQLSRLLEEENWKAREGACKAVGKLGSSAATKEILSLLYRLLNDEVIPVRVAAVSAVGEMGASAATEEMLSHLTRLLSDEYKDVRREAAEAVGGLGSSAATDEILSHLTRLLSDEDEYVRRTAAEAVGGLGASAATDEILSHLTRLLSDENSWVRCAAVEAVGELGASAANDEILSLLFRLREDKEEEVCQAVARTIGKLGSVTGADEILLLLPRLILHWTNDILVFEHAAAELRRVMRQGVRFFSQEGTLEVKRVTELAAGP